MGEPRCLGKLCSLYSLGGIERCLGERFNLQSCPCIFLEEYSLTSAGRVNSTENEFLRLCLRKVN